MVSCAQQVAPTGGDEDRDPPKVLNSEPLNESTNFQGNKLMLEFDEYVQLKNASAKLIVSPPLQDAPEFTLRGKRVELKWTDTLDQNTTYQFQFGDGIVDLRESNPLDSNIFVFSTGNYIDSLELKGTIKSAFDLQPMKDVWVMLYTEDVDSLPLTMLPRYYAKTDAQGIYRLRYLQPGSYKVFALFSEGQGYTYDNPDEQIGFTSELFSPIEPSKVNRTDSGEFSGPSMLVFQEFDSIQYVKEFLLTDNQVLVLRMQMPVDSMTLTELAGTNIDGWIRQWNKGHDSLALWFDSVLVADSLYLRIQTSGGFDDTVTVRKRSVSKAKKKQKKAVLGLQSTAKRSRQQFYRGMQIKATEPLERIYPEKWVLTLDSDTIDLAGRVTMNFMSIDLDVDWREGVGYKFIVPDSSVFSKFGKANDTLQFKFSTTSKDDYGQMKFSVNFEGVDHNLIWQLLLGDKVIDEQIIGGKATVSYDYLVQGKYQVKVLYDVNNNGEWDTGDYGYKRQPERIIYYDGQIEVRSGWEEVVEWNVGGAR